MTRMFFLSLLSIFCLKNIILPFISPSFPAIAIALNTSSQKIQLAVTCLIIGTFISKILTLMGGSNKLGSKSFLLTLIPCTIIGALLCIISNLYALLFGCLLQGIGIGAISSIIADLIKHKQDRPYSHTWSAIVKYVVITSIFATLAGGWLTHVFSWRGIFVLIAILAAGAFFLVLYSVPKKANIQNSDKCGITFVRKLLLTPKYIMYTSIFSSLNSCEAIFFASAPFVFLKGLHFAFKSYAISVSFFVIGRFLGFSLSNFLSLHIKHKNVILFSSLTALCSSLYLILVGFLTTPFLVTILPGIFCFGLAISCVEPSVRNFIAKSFTKRIAASSALMSLLLSSFSAVTTGLAAYFVKGNFIYLAVIYLIISIFAFSLTILSNLISN